MDLHFLSGFSPVPLGNGYLGRRVANRIQSARIFISVCVCERVFKASRHIIEITVLFLASELHQAESSVFFKLVWSNIRIYLALWRGVVHTQYRYSRIVLPK